MSYPFRTRDEQPRKRDDAPSLGVRVTFANDVKHFFPAATAEMGRVLAAAFVPEDLLNSPGTTIEWGERSGRLFVLKQHLAGPKLSQASDYEPPRVIHPDAANL